MSLLPFHTHRPALLGSRHFAGSSRYFHACRHLSRSLNVPLLRCSAGSDPKDVQLVKDSETDEPSISFSSETASQNSSGNVLLAVGAVAVAAASLFVVKTLDGGPALDRLRSTSMPLEVALINGRPTVLEFYADWCEVCNELAPMTLQVMIMLVVLGRRNCLFSLCT